MKMTPEISKFSHVKRIHLGGIINCVPSELKYDFEKNAKIMHKKSNWSSESLEIAQKFISTAVELEFEVVSETSFMNNKYEFGHLKARMLDGTLFDLANRLSTASVAEIITDNCYWNILRLDTIYQEIWKTINGVPLAVQQVVLPIAYGQVVQKTLMLNATRLPAFLQASIKPTNDQTFIRRQMEIVRLMELTKRTEQKEKTKKTKTTKKPRRLRKALLAKTIRIKQKSMMKATQLITKFIVHSTNFNENLENIQKY